MHPRHKDYPYAALERVVTCTATGTEAVQTEQEHAEEQGSQPQHRMAFVLLYRIWVEYWQTILTQCIILDLTHSC